MYVPLHFWRAALLKRPHGGHSAGGYFVSHCVTQCHRARCHDSPHLRAMTCSYVWHDSFICAPWLVHMCAVTRSGVCNGVCIHDLCIHMNCTITRWHCIWMSHDLCIHINKSLCHEWVMYCAYMWIAWWLGGTVYESVMTCAYISTSLCVMNESWRVHTSGLHNDSMALYMNRSWPVHAYQRVLVYTNEPWLMHTCEWHNDSVALYMNESWPVHTYQWVFVYINASWRVHTYEWHDHSVALYMNESWHCINTNQSFLHINESRLVPIHSATEPAGTNHFTCVTWLVHTCATTCSYVCNDSFIHTVPPRLHSRLASPVRLNITGSYVCRECCISLVSLVYTRDKTCSYVYNDFVHTHSATEPPATTRFICRRWRVQTCEITRPHVWHNLRLELVHTCTVNCLGT